MELDFNSLEIIREYYVDKCFRIIKATDDKILFFKRIEGNTFNLCSYDYNHEIKNLDNPIYREYIINNSYLFNGNDLIINPRGGDIELIDSENLEIERILFKRIDLFYETRCFEKSGDDLLVSANENIYLVKDVDDVQLTDITKIPIHVATNPRSIYGIINIDNIVYYLDDRGRLWKCDKVTSVEELNYFGTPDRLPDINSLDIESIKIYSIDGILTGTYLSVEDMYSNLTQQPGIVVVKTKTNKIYYYKLMR